MNNTVTYIPTEMITRPEIEQLIVYANQLRKVLRTNTDPVIIDRRPLLRLELNRVVTFLYKFNINLTGHLQ